MHTSDVRHGPDENHVPVFSCYDELAGHDENITIISDNEGSAFLIVEKPNGTVLFLDLDNFELLELDEIRFPVTEYRKNITIEFEYSE